MSMSFATGNWREGLAKAIRHEAHATRRYNVMEFCGGHTHAIFRYGVHDLMPENVSYVHGPGCPVCVLPIGRIDNALELAERPRRHPLQLWRHAARSRLQAA